MRFEWRPYVPVAKRRAQATKFAQNLAKKQGRALRPVKTEGRTIARTFWGRAWCEHLEHYSDFANRLPRGRTYVRNGSVVDLQITPGRVDAFVSGSEVYTVRVDITRLKPADWKQIKGDCAASIDSLLDLLAGRFSDGVMKRLTEPKQGLFPQPAQIKMACSCPDWAVLCKHVASVLYGVGARLDDEPELLFLLRGVDHNELVSQAVSEGNLDRELSGQGETLAGEDLGELFGIDLDTSSQEETRKGKPASRRKAKKTASPTGNQAVRGKKKAAKKKVVTKQKPAIVKKKKTKRTTATQSAKKKTRVKRKTAQHK